MANAPFDQAFPSGPNGTLGRGVDYPLRHSTLEQPVQHSAGIFQFGTAQRAPSVEVLTLAGAMASAAGAPLGDREFDVHTWLRQRYVALDLPDDGAVPFTLAGMARGLYGPATKSGTTRRDLLGALQSLLRTLVTIPGFDARSGTLDPDRVSHGLRLLDGLVTQGHYDQFRRTLNDDGPLTPEALALIGRMRGDAVLVAFLPDWSARAIAEGLRAPLDLDAQRELGGVAKRVWVQLNGQAFTPDEHGNKERLVLELDVDGYRALGFNHRRAVDRRRYLAQAIKRICEVDPTYLPSSTVERTVDASCDVLTVVRCTGARRQSALRLRHRYRTFPQEALPI